jgi:hypothetical protein
MKGLTAFAPVYIHRIPAMLLIYGSYLTSTITISYITTSHHKNLWHQSILPERFIPAQ